MALESFSPTTLVCLRYLISGGVMLIAAKFTGAHLPRGRELWLTAGWADRDARHGKRVPGVRRAVGAQRSGGVVRHHFAVLAGGRGSAGAARGAAALAHRSRMLVGVAGVAFLVAPAALHFDANPAVLGAFLLLQLGCAGWALGSIAQRKTAVPGASFCQSGAVQQFATGLVYAIPTLISYGEHREPIHWSPRGIGAIIYLMIFGSIIGYSAYVFVMDRLTVAVASIYTYVNPTVAVLLGWLIYHEPSVCVKGSRWRLFSWAWRW